MRARDITKDDTSPQEGLTKAAELDLALERFLNTPPRRPSSRVGSSSAVFTDSNPERTSNDFTPFGCHVIICAAQGYLQGVRACPQGRARRHQRR